MPKKGEKMATVIYTGALYEDAKRICTQGNTTIAQKCGKSASCLSIANRGRRSNVYKKIAAEKGYDESAELYAAPVNSYKTFCNLFWLNPDEYIVAPKLRPVSASELCKAPQAETNKIVLAIDGAVDSRNAVSNRIIGTAVKTICEACDNIEIALSNCTNEIINAFDFHTKNFLRFAEESRAGLKNLEVIAESAIDIADTLRKIDAKLDKLDTRTEELNQRAAGIAQTESGISSNVAKMTTFLDRFTKR